MEPLTFPPRSSILLTAFIGAVLFFIGFMESQKTFSLGLWDWRWSNLAMGFGVAWIMQLHMSWLAFVPLLLFALGMQAREGRWQAVLFAFSRCSASLSAAAAHLPDLWFQHPSGCAWRHHWFSLGQRERLFWDFSPLPFAFQLRAAALHRFSYARPARVLTFFPSDVDPRLLALGNGLCSSIGPIGITFSSPRHAKKDWTAVKVLNFGVFFLLYGCFLFSPDMAASFRILLFFPFVMLYSIYTMTLAAGPGALGWPASSSFVWLFFRWGYALRSVGKGISIYAEQKGKMALALEKNDYHQMAERRDDSRY